jgi:anaerobic selenocysteine-containing dehydrogenase
MVSVDFYLNETTRHAHIILPPTCALEHDHYDLIFNVFAVRNVARYNAPLFGKPEGTKHDWEIFTELGRRIGDALGAKPGMAVRPDQIVDMGLQTGPYSAARKHPLALSLKKLREHPHGLDLGPLQPSLPGRLQTADKRIQCAPPQLIADLPRATGELLQESATPELKLIGRRHLRSNNSWMHNSERLVKGKPRCLLLMHPQDAQTRGLADGSLVRVRSRVGEVEVVLQATEEMMPGVVSLPHGWGHARDGVALGVAQAHAGVSINDLTDELALDEVSGNTAFSGVAVTIVAAAA